MSWTAPKTFTANSTLTAADLNTFLRDNFLETVPAIVTTPGSIYVVSGLNAIAERIPGRGHIAASETTSSTSYTDLSTVGPSVTVTTGTRALVHLYSNMASSTGVGVFYSYEISGATTFSAIDSTALLNQSTIGERLSATILHTGLTPGSNTFNAQYRVSSGTGTYVNRRLAVIPL